MVCLVMSDCEILCAHRTSKCLLIKPPAFNPNLQVPETTLQHNMRGNRLKTCIHGAQASLIPLYRSRAVDIACTAEFKLSTQEVGHHSQRLWSGRVTRTRFLHLREDLLGCMPDSAA